MKKLILLFTVILMLSCVEEEIKTQSKGETHLNCFFVDDVVPMEKGQAFVVKFSDGNDWFYIYDRDSSLNFDTGTALKLVKK